MCDTHNFRPNNQDKISTKQKTRSHYIIACFDPFETDFDSFPNYHTLSLSLPLYGSFFFFFPFYHIIHAQSPITLSIIRHINKSRKGCQERLLILGFLIWEKGLILVANQFGFFWVLASLLLFQSIHQQGTHKSCSILLLYWPCIHVLVWFWIG